MITLVAAPDSFSAHLGNLALLVDGQSASGPLTAFELWARHWGDHLLTAVTQKPRPSLIEFEDKHGCWKYFIDEGKPSANALILGGGHVAGPLVEILKLVGYHVTMMDDREEFTSRHPKADRVICRHFDEMTQAVPGEIFQAAIIVTRGHIQDINALRQILNWTHVPPYLGMIGSRKKVAETMAIMRAEGVEEEKLAKVHAPIGLAIGAQTPAEIAVSITAEIIKCALR